MDGRIKTLKEHNQFIKESVSKKMQMLENKDFPAINKKYYPTVAHLLTLQEEAIGDLAQTGSNVITESTSSSDIQGIQPMLMPIVRRMIPAMLAFEVAGVQPMNAPVGMVFAIKPIFNNTANVPVKSTPESIIMTLRNDGTDDTGIADFVTGVDVTDAVTGATGTIVFKPSPDSTLALVKVTSESAEFGKGNELQVSTDATKKMTIDAVDENVAMYKHLLTGYAGTYATANAEFLGKDTREMGFTIVKKPVEAKVMRLKAQYSLEAEQDLKALHGLDINKELQTFLSQEIATEINADLVNDIKAYAKEGNEYIYNYDMNLSDGRWMAEKFRALAFVIEASANSIYITTRRGKGNILIVSPNVASVLEQISGFYSYNPTLNTLGNNKLSSDYSPENGFAGIFNSMKVFVDPWATEDYAVVGYKGSTEFDAGIFYCPFTPVTVNVVTDRENIRHIHFQTRYGKAENPFGGKNYFRYISCIDLPVNIPKKA